MLVHPMPARGEPAEVIPDSAGSARTGGGSKIIGIRIWELEIQFGCRTFKSSGDRTVSGGVDGGGYDRSLVAAKGRCDSWLTLEFSAIQGPALLGLENSSHCFS